MRSASRVLLCVAAIAVSLVPPAFPDCKVAVITSLSCSTPGACDNTNVQGNVGLSFAAAPVGGVPISNEGMTERVADLLIYDDGNTNAPNCFAANQQFSLTYSARIIYPFTDPAGARSLGDPSLFMDVYDSNGSTLLPVVQVAPTTAPNGAPASAILITNFGGAGTRGDLTTGLVGAAIRIRNIRIDATTINLGAGGLSANPAANVAFHSLQPTALNSASAMVGSPVVTTRNGAIGSVGLGSQSANGGTLTTPAQITWAESNVGASFYVPAASGVLKDIPACAQGVPQPCVGATSVTFDVEAIPPGVTLTFPASISTSASSAATGVILRARTTQSLTCAIPTTFNPGSCRVIYDTIADGPQPFSLNIVTAATPNDGANGQSPAIGLTISNGAAFGTATIQVLLGPTTAAAFSGDDTVAAPSAIGFSVPTYTPNITGQLSRRILGGNWFIVQSSAPVAQILPLALDFGTQIVNGLSTPKTVSVTNVSNASPMAITGITVSTGFLQNNNCPPAPQALPPGSTCTITVNFVPVSGGQFSGSLIINDNAGGPHTVTLTGNALTVSPVPAVVSLQPSQILATSGAFNLLVIGGVYVPGAAVQWDGSPRLTTYVTQGVLQAAITSQDIATPGVHFITVVNPAPGGGASNSLPFTVATTPIPQANFTYVIPHVVSGAGFVTKTTLLNMSLLPNSVTVNYVSQAGVWTDTQSYSLAGSGNVRIATQEAQRFGPAQVQWAIVGSQASLGINTFFEIGQSQGQSLAVINTVGFNDAPQGTNFTLPIELEPGPNASAVGRTVGVAMANVSAQQNTVTMKLYDRFGNLLGTRTVTLGAFSQTAFDVGSSFASVLPAGNFVGLLTVSGTQSLAAIGVGDDFGPFFSIPVINGRPQ